MKVRVVVTLDIDPEAWALEQGLSIDAVRADVQSWASATLHELAESNGVLRTSDRRQAL